MVSVKKIDSKNLDYSAEAVSAIKKTLMSFDKNYPQIEEWYDSKIISGISEGNRYILLATRNNQLAGFSILKEDEIEKKICTFFVYPEHRGHQVAENLFERSFQELNTSKPLITIPENKLNDFQKYIKKYKFRLGNCSYYYNKNLKEYMFNGLLH